ncbi:hypothetical protein KQX54_017846 [Cotesia glomerata]|uniref:Uncharacterized protein n=1 Tax=Cotesia glomerata TaxID=32391 RepID=A0AAV7J6X4_COTGL|nr:hypothetical protein KQX54_017846 [Cotesia glomerata]
MDSYPYRVSRVEGEGSERGKEKSLREHQTKGSAMCISVTRVGHSMMLMLDVAVQEPYPAFSITATFSLSIQ